MKFVVVYFHISLRNEKIAEKMVNISLLWWFIGFLDAVGVILVRWEQFGGNWIEIVYSLSNWAVQNETL